MSSGINANTAQVVMSFLTPKDTAKLAQTCKQFRDEAAKNACIVVAEHVCWGNAKSGMTWEKQQQTRGQKPGYEQHYASTKENALALVEELKKDTKTFAVKVGFVRDFHSMDWWNFDQRENYRQRGRWVFKWQR